ncbi:Small auxin-up RNA [Dillenia turbinata]|uniref:Small auxin-up RNA n=1 Tax=Dillenia turbinata TaxID=194707 RepID=A0AAN8UAD7_9MAGN
MAKIGKLTKLKSALKKWPSFGKLGRTTSSRSSVAADDDGTNHQNDIEINDKNNNNNSQLLHTVYVGKSRRKYLLGSDVVNHPLFKELVDKSEDVESLEVDEVVGFEGGAITVSSCEVVMFEHLLWMLQNADPQVETLHDLVHFYAY